MAFRTSSSEFPNANFELHEGAIWICVRPAGRVQAVVRPPAPIAETPKSDDVAPTESAPSETTRALPPQPAAPVDRQDTHGEEPDDYPRLVDTLVAVLLESGATRAAACIRALLDGDGVESTAVPFENALGKGLIVQVGSRIGALSRGAIDGRSLASRPEWLR